MVSPQLPFIVLSLCALLTSAAKPLGHQTCVASCYYSLVDIKFANRNETLTLACTNPLRISSTFYCIKQHCEDADIEPGVGWWAATCKGSKKKVTKAAYESAVADVTPTFLSKLPKIDLKSKSVANEPNLPSEHNWLVVHRSVTVYDNEHEFHNKVR